MKKIIAASAVALLSAACFAPAFAADPAPAVNASMLQDFNFDKPAFAHNLPFATRSVVIEVDSKDPARWKLALNNAQNIQNDLGAENVRVNVVAFGPGLHMLLQDSVAAKRIAAQNAEGIEFDACHNTMKAMEKKSGHMPVLVPAAVIVPSGVVRIMQLEKAGFAFLKP
jgi:intracellular sulfur oxidation DsrE/DsrF family protein